MPQNDLWKRYLDAGLQFTQMTQQRAEAIVRDLVEQGQVQAEQTQTAINELVDRSRQNTERMLDTIRKEVRNQLAVAEVVTKDAAARLQAQIDDLRKQLPATGRSGRPAKKTAKKTTGAAKKATTNKSTAKKATAKKTPAKKTTAKKATAKKATAKKTTAKKSAGS